MIAAYKTKQAGHRPSRPEFCDRLAIRVRSAKSRRPGWSTDDTEHVVRAAAPWRTGSRDAHRRTSGKPPLLPPVCAGDMPDHRVRRRGKPGRGNALERLLRILTIPRCRRVERRVARGITSRRDGRRWTDCAREGVRRRMEGLVHSTVGLTVSSVRCASFHRYSPPARCLTTSIRPLCRDERPSSRVP